MDEAVWERARLIPVSGITGPDEQERRGSSALLAVIASVKEFGRALAAPLGAPAGAITTYIEVPFKLGEKNLRPDGVIRVVRGARSWTALVEVKTGRNELRAAQIESYLDLARQEGFEAVLTISNQLVTAPGEHPVTVDGRKTKRVSLHHLSWSQVYTEALIEQGNRSVADPDQAWILAEFVRYLGHPRSGAVDFDDMGPSWVAVRDAARAGTLTQNDKGAAEVTNRFGQLISFAAMGLSRQLGVEVAPVLSPADAKDPGRRLKAAVVTFAETGRLHGALCVPHAVAPIEITADLRAGQVRCSVTVLAPRAGRPATRVSWLARQLRDAPGALCIEPIAAFQRGKGSAKSLAQVREDPKVLVDDPKRELRAFTVSLTANVGTKRGQGKGSFVSSVVSAIDRFYAEVVQHLKPWTQAPPKVKDDEPSPADLIVAAEIAATEARDIEIGNGLPSREAALAPTPGLTESARDRQSERRDLQIAKRSTDSGPGGRFVKFCAQRLLRRARWLPFALPVVAWDDLDGACSPCANRPCSRQDGISNSVAAQGGGRFMREWQYWTRNKLSILAGYLPAFNVASKRSPERLYIDLMAGEPFNRDKETGEEFDGSARLALSCTPPFTRIALCEMPQKAAALEKDLRTRYPDRSFRAYPGDCNETIGQVLADLGEWRWAPTFVFADQQAAEIHWETLKKISAFRDGKTKAEIWLLTSPSMVAKGVAGTNGEAFARRVDTLYGTPDWRRIQLARDRDIISAEEYRDEMVNLQRWRLEQDLGYVMTARIPMRMPSGLPIYDMVFATDHPVGNKIMTDLYRKAAEREPLMRQEAKAKAKDKRSRDAGLDTLFDLPATSIPVESLAWDPTDSWDPATRSWWHQEPDFPA